MRILQPRRHLLLLLVVVTIVVVVVVVVVVAVVVMMVLVAVAVVVHLILAWQTQIGAIAGVRVGKYNLGTTDDKCKVSVRVDKHKLGARTGKYKLWARTGNYQLWAKKSTFLNSVTHPTMMKLRTVVPYLKKIQKIYKSRDTNHEFCGYQHFFNGNHQLLLYQ